MNEMMTEILNDELDDELKKAIAAFDSVRGEPTEDALAAMSDLGWVYIGDNYVTPAYDQIAVIFKTPLGGYAVAVGNSLSLFQYANPAYAAAAYNEYTKRTTHAIKTYWPLL
jgi:hypothetical protein